MTQLQNTIDDIREHFEGLVSEPQRKLFCEEWVKVLIRCQQADIPFEMFAQMVATVIGAGLGGHVQELGNTQEVRDKIFEGLGLASGMMFVGAEGASKGAVTFLKYQKYAKRKDRAK